MATQGKKTQTKSIKKLFMTYAIILGVCVLTGVLMVVSCGIAYAFVKNMALIYSAMAFISVTSIIIIVSTVFYYLAVKRNYLDEMFIKTSQNYNTLLRSKNNLTKYDDRFITEFRDLNVVIDNMNEAFSHLNVISEDLDYTKFKLQHPNPIDHQLVTIDSFLKNIKSFVLASKSFRNAVLFFSIEEVKENITENDYKFLAENIKKYITLDGMLYAVSTNRGGILVYCPHIDSISYFKDAIKKVIKDSVIYEYTPTGVNLTKVRCSMVVYPYSNLDDLMTDLRYADRQGKEINIYLPERFNNTNRYANHETIFLNDITKVFLEYKKLNLEDDMVSTIKKATKLMDSVRASLGFDNVGTIMYEEFSTNYFCTFDGVEKGKPQLFDKNQLINKDFISCLEEVVDEDDTYYFSKRKNASDKIGRYLDVFGIQSGFFSIVKNKGIVTCVVYFVNRDHDAYQTSYSRELLLVFATYLAGFNRSIQDKKVLDSANNRVKDVLRVTDIDMYVVEKETNTLTWMSDGMKERLPSAKVGDKCYQALYGRGEPCDLCPLNSLRKMKSVLGKENCISSNVLSRRKTNHYTILVEPDSTPEYDTNRFHPDLFIFSKYALMDRINGLYFGGVRGTLVLISIDNYEDLVEKFKSEGYWYGMRSFVTALQQQMPIKADVFAYTDNTLAILLNEEGRQSVIRDCEHVFKIASNLRLDNAKYFTINPTFVVFDFPLDHPNPQDFNRYITKYIKENKDIYNQNLIVIAGSSYRRSADRENFVLSVLQQALHNNQIHTKLLPIIGVDDKTINGAEMLLRLSDEFLNVGIPAYEFVEVAKKHNLISKLSAYLIDYMGKIYQKYGVTAFKSAGFRYFSINTDTSFLKDDNFLNNVGELMQKYNLPKNFLSFEIEEKDIADNYDFIKTIYRRIVNYDINLVADNYTGEFVSLDKIKEIGFDFIKVSRKVVSEMDKDVTRFNEIKEGIIDCHELGIKVCLVGIENKEQHTLLSEFKENFSRQGYFYNVPIDVEELVEKLKRNNLR